MDKPKLLEVLMLLSALESWSFAEKHRLPDYLGDKLVKVTEELSKELLDGVSANG